jgi:N-acetylglucosaminyldiphosphoundecaprenol N-acetyl-beta-D-mannosaminyltransferase
MNTKVDTSFWYQEAEYASLFETNQSSQLPNLRIELLNRRITLMTEIAIIDAIHQACIKDEKITVSSYNIHSFNLSMQIPWFYEFQQGAELALCDGFGVLKALQYMGLKLPLQYRVSGTDFVPKLIEHCNQNNFSMFLLGTKPQYLTEAIKRTKDKYPQLKIAGHHGYFDKTSLQQNQAIVEQINQVKPNILIVGLGMPLQEQWILKYRPYLDVNVFIPCGAIIDRLAGVVVECPRWLSLLGLEWLHRLIHEPQRLSGRYLLGNPAFMFQIALAKSLGLSTVRVSKM